MRKKAVGPLRGHFDSPATQQVCTPTCRHRALWPMPVRHTCRPRWQPQRLMW